MRTNLLLTKALIVVALLLGGVSSVWAETVGTPGTGDAFASRKYSTAYEIAPGETYHFTFTNTSYGSNNWNNWLLDCKATADTSVDDWYFTMRSDNHGWGTSYNATMRYADFVWADFQTVMNGATVDMYINYNSTDKIIRTYATITKGETTWHYNFASKAINAESVFLFLSEELAVLDITTAEKVASLPTETYSVYKRSISDGYGYTWDTNSTGTDYTGWTNSGGTKTLDLTDGLKYELGNAGGSVQTTISPTIGNIINVEANFLLRGATGANNSGQNYSFFRYGNIYITNEGQSCQSYYTLNGAPSIGNPGTNFHGTSAGSSSIYRTTGISYRLLMEINTLTNTLVSMQVYVNGSATASVNITNQILSSYDYTTLEIGYQKGRSSSNSTHKLKDITVKETPQSITTVDYTVKFQDALGNTLKDDVVYDNGAVGEIYQAANEDMETFYNNADESLATKKYIYNSGQNTSAVASSNAEDNVITLVFDVYDKTAYTVTAQVSGADLSTLASGTAYFDGSTTAYWSKYINESDQWYVADETTYGTTITTATNNVAYTTTDAIDYFFEFENMTISRSFSALNGDTRASNGKATTLYGNANAVTISTVPAGIYTVSLNGIKWADGYADTYQIAYSTDNTNWTPIGLITFADGEEGVKTLENAIIPTAAYIRIWTTGGVQTPRRYLDYMTLKKTADLPETVPATLGANGYTTFASQYCLDLRNLPAGLKAYTATLSGVTLSFTECTQAVAAGTGLLLQGTGGETYNIPVVSTFTTVDNNALTGVTAVTPLKSDETNYIFAMKKATNATDELTFAPLTSANNVNFPAGKAYISVPASVFNSGARALTVSFGDEATGVKELKNSRIEELKSCYNLQGRRVALPTKGLYIKDGRKVVIK